MTDVKVNNLFTFDFYGHSTSEKHLVQRVFKELIAIFNKVENIHWFTVERSEMSDTTEVEITYYADNKKQQERFPYTGSVEELKEAYRLISSVSVATTEFLDQNQRFALNYVGTEQYFKLTVFDREFMNGERMIEAGFLEDDILVYLINSISQSKNIAILGDMFSGKTTLLNIIANLLDNSLILSFQESNEIKSNKNTIIRMNYKDLTSHDSGKEHLSKLSTLKPDYTFYEEPPYGLIEKPIEPFAMSYLLMENVSRSIPYEFKGATDIVVITKESDTYKFKITDILEKTDDGEFVSVMDKITGVTIAG